MAQKLYELALEIQGKLDGSFNSAMKSAQGDLKALESDMKAWKDRQKDVSGVDAAYVKAREGARQLGGELARLKGQQQAVSDYQAQRKATTETARAYRNVQREVKALTAAYAKDKTPANKKAMQEATKQAKTLEREYNKNKNTLTKMGEKLKGAGVNTKDLSNEQVNLARKIAEATKEQERYNQAADRAARNKAFWSDLTGRVREYSRYAMSAVKWTSGIAATLSTSAYMITKSTATAGDHAAKLGKKIGATAEEVQELQHAANYAGVENMDIALQTMVKNVSAAATKLQKEGKHTDVFFKSLHLDPRALSKAGPARALEMIAEQLKTLKSYEQDNVLDAIFGKQRGGMKEMLSGGAEGLRAARQQARELGIISNEAAGNSETFLDNVTDMQRAISGLKDTIGVELMPVVNDIVKEITEWVKQNRHLVSDEIKDWVIWLKDHLPGAWEEFKKGTKALGDFVGIISSGIEKIGGLTTALEGLAAFWAAKKLYGLTKWIGEAGAALGGSGAAAGATGAAGGATGAGGAAASAGAGSTVAGTIALPATAAILSMAWLWNNMDHDFHETREDRRGLGHIQTAAEKEAADKRKNDFADAIMELAAQRKIDVKREDVIRHSGNMISAIGGYERSRDFLPENLRELVDATQDARKQQTEGLLDAIMPTVNELNEQGKLNVKREDITQHSQQLYEAIRGNEQAIKDLPDHLRPVLEALRPAQTPLTEHHARGGLVSKPIITSFAERGPEMGVPLSEADRGLGISRLIEAARKLNVPVLGGALAPSSGGEKTEGPATPGSTMGFGGLLESIEKLGTPTINVGSPELGISSLLEGVSVIRRNAEDAGMPAPDFRDVFNKLGGQRDEPNRQWDISRPLKSGQEGAVGESKKQAPSISMPDITFAPTVYITGQGDRGTAEQVNSALKQSFEELLREHVAELERVAYGTK